VIYKHDAATGFARCDGLIFVADSQYEKMAENVESSNLEENLRALKLDLPNPLHSAIQQADLPTAAPVDYMEFLLNNREVRVRRSRRSPRNARGCLNR